MVTILDQGDTHMLLEQQLETMQNKGDYLKLHNLAGFWQLQSINKDKLISTKLLLNKNSKLIIHT